MRRRQESLGSLRLMMVMMMRGVLLRRHSLLLPLGSRLLFEILEDVAAAFVGILELLNERLNFRTSISKHLL